MQAMKLQLSFSTFYLATFLCIFIASYIISHSIYSKFYPLFLHWKTKLVISSHLWRVLLSCLSFINLPFALVCLVKSFL